MKQLRRLFLFLLLNVVVSACVTLAVLVTWDRTHGPLPTNLIPRALGTLQAGTPTALSSAAGTSTPGPAPTEAFTVYLVQDGDTFESIAKSNNMSVEELMAVNGFSQVQPLGAGELLRIPVYPHGTVIIEGVIGAGDLDSERIVLKHRGEGELILAGWRIEDSQGNIFIFPQFPQLTLFGGGAVNIYTRSGVNTVIDLYWGLKKSLWSPGVTITLKDGQGNTRATYIVP